MASTSTLISPPIDSRLQYVARTFVNAQEARHDADYDTAKLMIRLEVLNGIAAVERAFVDWRSIRASRNARVFLAALFAPETMGTLTPVRYSLLLPSRRPWRRLPRGANSVAAPHCLPDAGRGGVRAADGGAMSHDLINPLHP